MLSQACLSRAHITRRAFARCINFKAKSISDEAPLPPMPECEYTPEPYSGLSYERVMEIRSKHLSPTIKATFTKHLLESQGKMQWVWDHEGKRYLDMFAGIVTLGVGHCHPRVSKALMKQAGLLWHTTQLFMNSPLHEYAEKLTNEMPGDLKVCFFTNSGSEANDLAMLLAREYTKAFDIISFRNAYHGTSPYTIGLTAHGPWKHSYANGFGIHHTVNPDVYRGVWGGKNCRDSLVQTDRPCDCAQGQCKANDNYLQQLEDVLIHSVGKKPAAFFAEPIQGVGGVVQYPKGFLKKAYAMIRERGGVCVSDEVQTGFGRTGSHMWGFQTHDVIPDIVTMAKTIGNGIPMGAVVTRKEIVDTVANVNHLNTFAGNPLATATACEVLDVIREEKVMENCQEVGDYLILKLAKLRDEFDIVGDVRGKGLMLGMEMVESKASKKPLSIAGMNAIRDAVKDMGVIIGSGGLYANTLRIKPPMCITKEDADFAVAVIRKGISDYVKTRN